MSKKEVDNNTSTESAPKTIVELEIDEIEGVGPATKAKLNDIGIVTILDLAVKSPSEVADAMGSDLARASELCNKARAKLVELKYFEDDFVSASEIYKRRKSIDRVSTGSKNLDDLLAGGIETQAVTEFYGEFGSGKTQICHTLCVQVQTPREQGGLGSKAVYIDTENTFRPERIAEIARARGLDPDSALDGIIVAKAFNSSHQELILRELGAQVRNWGIKLVIVDSAVAHYRAEFLGRGTLSERQQRLNRFMHSLVRTAEVYNLAVVATNQVQSTPDTFFGDPTKATGGHVVAHTSTYRIYLRKSGKNRVARMVDSPYHAERETIFVLNDRGIDDPPEEGIGSRRKNTS
ncbi:MAG: DNA repair and recombination protein RadA [Thaumarchaeota archaeon]|nr:DNA repair and recombination protein RadA [Nitrososphaerota archaeon]MCL5068955.1 DNA repair and recombination protein RadA [Nitrososphaerota archaeon]MDG6906997.1 DNA repair and recombination protein RadA [Nitrososphaerota archaeon]